MADRRRQPAQVAERRHHRRPEPRAGARDAPRLRLHRADLKRPLVGVANTWIEIGPCNYHLRDLAVSVKAGIRAAGGTPMEFNTVSISDGITMGSAGMRTSLVSREVIADSIELVTRGNLFDALVVLVGCDKTIPGGAMALARLDIPGSFSTAARSRRDVRTGATSRSRTCSKPSAPTPPARCPTPISARSRTRPAPAPAPAAASSPPTRWPRPASSSASRRWAAATCPAIDPRQGRRRRARRRAGHGRAAARPPAVATSSRATSLENAIAVGRRDRRIDQRRAPPDGDRARSGRAARRSTTSTASARARRSWRDLKPGGRFVAVDLHRAGGTRWSRSACSRPARSARRRA